MNADVNSAEITYEQSKELARNADPSVRVALAKRADLRPEILYFLAEDPEAEVRRAVAENTAAPGHTDILLARDSDTDVRSNLAVKIATVAPNLSSEERDKVRRSTHGALEMLARDQIKVVRQVLADAMKDISEAPEDIVKTLARDMEIDVSGPILEHSPVLSESDLVEIIEATPTGGALNAIARRENLQENVADAIVATDDHSAIGDLLGNSSAQIREQTIDDLINRAEDVELWHKPLVSRPKLPAGAAQRMAQYLAGNLLNELQQRADLGESVLQQVKSVVKERFGGSDIDIDAVNNAPEPVQDFLNGDPPMDMVLRLYNARKLDASMVGKALMSADNGFVFAAMLVKAGVEPAVGKRIFRERNPKGILALCWKAQLPIKLAVQIQQRLGRLSPDEVMVSENDTDYPLSDEELEWQIEFFRDLAMKSSVGH